MITVISTVLSAIFKVVQVAAKVALNRATVIITFVATIGTTFVALYQSLTDVDGFLSGAIEKVSSVSLSLGQWVSANEYAQMIGYALSIDTLVDGLISTLLFVVCTLSGFLLTALVGVFFSVLPLLSDLALSALKHQMARSLASS